MTSSVKTGPIVVFADPIRDGTWSYDLERQVLEAAGVRLVVPEDDAAARRAFADADLVVVTGVGRLEADAIADLHAVGILCASVGMDKVDHAAAKVAGIPVRNIPGYCTDEVADHALTLLLAAWRHLIPIAGRAGPRTWASTSDPDVRAIRRLRGATLGVVGAGRIGRAVAARCRAFGMLTIAADPYLTDQDPLLPIVPLGDLLSRSDGIVLCASADGASGGALLDAAAFDQVRMGVVLVNVARGSLIDEAALARALEAGVVGAAALDVRDPEPPRLDGDPLAGAPRLLLTPHIAASSREAAHDLHEMTARISLDMLRDGGRLVGSPAAGGLDG